jgi:DNA-binding response OmpR family regulator
MPEMDGWKVLERIREMSNLPVLMLTAADQERNKVRGLRGGADDYITKPFSGEEFLARIDAALRRSAVSSEDTESGIYRDAEVTIDYAKHEAVVRGLPVELSPTKFRLLGMLTEHEGQVLNQEQLLDRVWGRHHGESADVVRSYIGYLRKKIERDSDAHNLIETVRGLGYRYRAPNWS